MPDACARAVLQARLTKCYRLGTYLGSRRAAAADLPIIIMHNKLLCISTHIHDNTECA